MMVDQTDEEKKIFEDPLGDLIIASRPYKIVTNQILRDVSTERKIIEMARESIMYVMLATGGVLILIAIMW
jgi:hypothetical protein